MLENLPSFLLRPILWLAERWPRLGKKINMLAVNSLVNSCRHRPHPWSTAHNYVSWTSLTDQRWSARHLPAKPIPIDAPPPEKLIGLFKLKAGKQRLSKKSTCLFPAFAQYLTDGFIRTRMPDTSAGETDEVRKQNTSNHQIDLCPLYGRVLQQTAALRLRDEAAGKRGRMKSQLINGEEYAPFLFAGEGIKPEFAVLDKPLGLDRILSFTPDPEGLRGSIFAFGGDRANAVPQVSMMNTLLLREHNHLAGEIERSHPAWDDERVFQTARNCVIVIFIKIVVEEYINHISPSVRFSADPPMAWDAPWNKTNWMTTEFSLLYRWHSLIPETINWNGTAYPASLTLMNNQLLLEGGLARSFSDLSSQAAGELGAFNTIDALLRLEMDAIKQGRLCELAPYSDYRAHVSLSRPKDFADISKDPQVVEFLKSAYKSVDEIDFYVGLFAEDSVKNSPLPPLLLRMVAVDAFSQALTNPLLSKSVFNPETFSEPGWEAIQNTKTLRDVLERNVPGAIGNARISMTRSDWKPSW